MQCQIFLSTVHALSYLIQMTSLCDNSNVYIHFTDVGTKRTELSNLSKDNKVVNGKDGILSAARAGAYNVQLAPQVGTSEAGFWIE